MENNNDTLLTHTEIQQTINQVFKVSEFPRKTSHEIFAERKKKVACSENWI